MIAVKENTFQSMEEINCGEFNNIFAVRIRYGNHFLRIISVHSPQECDKSEARTAFYDEVKVQIERCEIAGDKMILLGDFNARIHNSGGDTTEISPNGKLLEKVVSENDLTVVNLEPITSGKFTRIQKRRHGDVAKSTLDYVMVKDPELVLNMVIDEEKIFCPYRETMSRNTKKVTFSDHCAILIDTDIQASTPNREATGTNYKTWKFTEEGYTTYKIESIEPLEAKWSPDSTQAYAFWMQDFEKVLSRCFEKKTIKIGPKNNSITQRNKSVRNILSTNAKKGKIQRELVRKYTERVIELEVRQEIADKTTRIKQTMASLTEQEKFSPNGYWKLKKAADNKLKVEPVYTIMKENGVEVSGAEAIKGAYREEFQHRLRTRSPPEGWNEYVDELNHVIRSWLAEKSATSPPFTNEELDNVINRLKKGKSAGMDSYPPEVFIYAGPGVRNSLLQLLNQIKESRIPPDQWDIVKIVTIYKKKGSKKLLKYYRGIFLALIVSKLFEGLIKGRIEPNLQRINILQAGARSNRGPADQLFLVRGCVDHYVAINQPLHITAYDYEQAFDSLWVEKCILALKKLDVSQEMLQLIYNLNKKAEVVVKTPYGLTETFTTEPIVKQGTVLGSILCSGSTAEYCGRNEGVPVGNMMLSSLLFVDDVLDMNDTELKRDEAHRQAVLFTNENNLSLSGSKCYCMTVNNLGKSQEALVIDDKKKVTPCSEIVYLGDVFNEKGDNSGLIKDRIARGTKAMIIIESLVREGNLGVFEVSVWLLLYRSLFVSTVLFNSQTWSRLTKTDLKQLETLQMKALKKILHLPSSMCNSFLLLELGVLPIMAEIHRRQLGYLHRVLNLEEDDPVHCMFKNLVEFDVKGEKNWWSQVKPLLHLYGLPEDLKIVANLSKDVFKKMVNKGVVFVVAQQLKRECASLKKTSSLAYEEFQTQMYLKLMYPYQARIILLARSQRLDIKDHNSYLFSDGDPMCRKCRNQYETLDHVLNCGRDEEISSNIYYDAEYSSKDLLTTQLSRTALRIQQFYDDVKEINE